MSAPLNRTMAVVAVLAACASLMVASPAAAQSGPRLADTKTTTRAAVSSSWWNAVGSGSLRANPHTDYGNAGTFGAGDSMWLQCYFFGGPAGQYGNKLWYWAYNYTRGEQGFINDTNLNTPGTAANPQPQAEPCLPAGTGSDYNYPGDPQFKVVNAASTVNWGNSPSTMWAAGFGFVNNDTAQLHCYFFGGPAGQYGNKLWYLAYDVNRNTYGWINDTNLNTPGTAANPQPQTGRCW
ncbi:hypothetical protein [Micromonospora sp. NPDC047187]|uniref:hypothetical protein n=1 Tax=Micromonospora sp. NPDC047187 TaxID=3155262 RepID=UPI0033F1CE3A